MAIWSSFSKILTITPRCIRHGIQRRTMSDHRIFPLETSRFQWTKFKDLINLYLMVGAIPIGVIVLYANIFIGPATLSELPTDREPEFWEYYRHPITRFIAKHVRNNPQEDYEKFLHAVYEEAERIRMRQLEQEVRDKIYHRMDYQSWYYRPILAKYQRKTKEIADECLYLQGD